MDRCRNRGRRLAVVLGIRMSGLPCEQIDR